LEEAIPGETYYLRGVLRLSEEGEGLGNIVVTYDSVTKGLELRGQKLFTRASGSRPDFWLSPEGWNSGTAPCTGRERSNPTNAQTRGVVSSAYDISEGLKFDMIHLPGSPWSCPTDGRGFALENFTNDTDTANGAVVPGIGNDGGRYASMIFVKQP
jgi:hypothetical protein